MDKILVTGGPWANNGMYFMSEQSNNKRTPGKLGMVHLTEKSFRELLETKI